MRSARKIRKFVERELLDGAVRTKDPLAEGRLDSMAILRLIGFVEDEFGVSFDDEDDDDVAAYFSSLDRLADAVDAKRRAVR